MSTTTDRIQAIAKAEGYLATKVVDGKVYGVTRFIFTTGLVADVTDIGYDHRYCFENHADAVEAFAVWVGGDPTGNWVKRKGRGGDFANPNYARGRP